MRRLGLSLATSLTLVASGAAVASEPPAVVVSIKPLHGLAAALMEGVGEPLLLLDGTASPHGYSLRPSEARALSEADLVFWVGPTLEAFLVQSLDSLADQATVVTALEVPGMHLREAREGGVWEGHDHDHHGDAHHEDDHHEDAQHDDDHHEDEHHEEAHHDDEHHEDAHHEDDHHEEEHAGHGAEDEDHHEHHEEHAEADAHHENHDDHHIDPHVWLDPHNAEAMAQALAQALIASDPDHAETYRSNLAALEASLEALDQQLEETLHPVMDRPFIVFHDAYIYLEAPYQLTAAGSITVSPDQRPGARRVAEIRDLVEDRGAVCIFAEPQFSPALIDSITEGSEIGSGVLDPLGSAIDKGPKAYHQILLEMAENLESCLTVSG